MGIKCLVGLLLLLGAGACLEDPAEPLSAAADDGATSEPTREQARRMDGKTDSGGDICELWGWYADGICDLFCPNPDPDCDDSGTADWCEELGWYGDGICDAYCPDPDPDCDGGSADWCETWGWYGDGICDSDCPEPDPDCEPDEDPTEDCGHVEEAEAGVCLDDRSNPLPAECCLGLYCDRDADCAQGHACVDDECVIPDDCRTHGCGEGDYCVFCWVGYSCIPEGAIC